MTLARLGAKKLTFRETKLLVQNAVDDFSKMSGLCTMILFGSAAEGTMTNGSDLDIIMIFDTPKNREKARKTAPILRKKATWPMDILFVDKETYLEKSSIGGVYFVADREGKVIYGKKP